MPAWLKRWITPPAFPEDEEETNRARLLMWINVSITLFAFISFLGAVFSGMPVSAQILIIAQLLFNLFVHHLIQKRKIHLVSLIVLLQGYFITTAAVISIGTVRAPIISAYMFLIIVAGVLFGLRGIWLTTVAASLCVGGLMLAEVNGLLPAPVTRLAIAQWINYTMFFGLAGSVSYFATQLTRSALQRSRTEIEERRHAEELYWRLFAEMEQRVSERTTELSAANQALENASRLKNEFLASMSHELRTPLTGILGLSESMQMQIYGPVNERQLKSLKNIEASGRHLLDLINDILDLSKIEAGELTLRVEKCSIAEICQASLQLTKGMANKKRMVVEYSNTLTHDSLYADARRVKQMLVNLLSNAIKFTPQGGSLGLEASGSADDQVVHLAVWDQGIGIKPEDMHLLFKPFIQIDSSLSRQSSGTGLGLSLVSQLTELHNGSIRVDSTPGAGSRFTITLPWGGAQPDGLPGQEPVPVSGSPAGAPPAASAVAATAPVPAPAVRATLLFADDNPMILETVVDFLSASGYRMIAARSGKELVELARDNPVDLILTDIQMPGLDGLQAIRQIRAAGLHHLNQAPIIAITALAMPGDKERFLEAGASHYLSKPLKLAELLQLVQELT